MQKVFIRSPYNYDTDEASNASSIGNFPEGKTVQHFKDECDINRIVAQFQRGVTPVAPEKIPLGDDFVGITDYQSAMNAVRKGQEAFAELPATVRAQFNNDPMSFVDFVTNPDNIDSVRDLGLAPSLAAVPTKPTSEETSVQ